SAFRPTLRCAIVAPSFGAQSRTPGGAISTLAQRAVRPEVADRAGGIAEPVVETREVVVRVRRAGLGRQRALVGGARLVEAPEVLEHDAEVEGGRRVARPQGERGA